MLPSGHIAAGVLVGAERRRRSDWNRAALLAGGVVGACLPDCDLAIPFVLDRLGIEHRLNSGRHHSWATHTPLFWGVVARQGARIARHPRAPAWAPEAASLLTTGVAVHIAQDATANTVALLWPLGRCEYGLGLDRLAGETDHVAYVRAYPSSPAGVIEGALVLAALAAAWRVVRA
jgi:hypothetical protein